MIAIKKYSSKLMIWSVKMPNAPYSNRCVQFKKMKLSITFCILSLSISSFGQGFVQPDTLNFVPEEIYKKIARPIDLVLSIDLNGDGQKDYIVKQGVRENYFQVYFEYWLSHDFKLLLKRNKPTGGIDYDFYINLDSDLELELISAYGYEDGIDYSISNIDYERGKEELLFHFNPVIIVDNEFRWGYPWDLKDIYTLKRKDGNIFIYSSTDHDVVRDGNITIPENQKIFPVIFFGGTPTQESQVEEIRNKTYLSIEQIKKTVHNTGYK